jgi:hypothetical protein
VVPPEKFSPRKPAVSHRARLHVPAAILRTVTGWIARRCRRPEARPLRRAATVHTQVLLGRVSQTAA